MTRRQQALARDRAQDLDEKICSKCKQIKSFDEFSVSTRNRCGRLSDCKSCRNAHRKATHDPVRARAYNLRRNYKLTHEQYEAMAQSQGYACAICGKHVSAMPVHSNQLGYLHVDHDHKTGVVRGLLCNPCNAALGLLRDDCTVVHALLAYLQLHGS